MLKPKKHCTILLNTHTKLIVALLSLTLGCPVISQAASLFGDHSCKDWGNLEYATKKSWTNAFLAPLSLTYQSIQKTRKDNYNDDPLSYAKAIESIDNFCKTQSAQDASAGAMQYLKNLSEE